MEDEGSPMPTPLLLGKPFMKTAQTKIDVKNGSLTMEFDGETVSFKVLNEKGDPHDFQSCNAINVFNSLLQQNSKGPYKENQMENESFVLNVIPWKKRWLRKRKLRWGGHW